MDLGKISRRSLLRLARVQLRWLQGATLAHALPKQLEELLADNLNVNHLAEGVALLIKFVAA